MASNFMLPVRIQRVLSPPLLISTIDSPGSRLIADIISQGMEEGTVKTEYPKQMGEMVMILMNMWVNPYVWPADEETLKANLGFISGILSLYGFGKLEDIVSAETMRNVMAMAKKYKKFCILSYQTYVCLQEATKLMNGKLPV